MFSLSSSYAPSGDPSYSPRDYDHVRSRRSKNNVLMGLAVTGTITWITSNRLRWKFPEEAMILRVMTLFFLIIGIGVLLSSSRSRRRRGDEPTTGVGVGVHITTPPSAGSPYYLPYSSPVPPPYFNHNISPSAFQQVPPTNQSSTPGLGMSSTPSFNGGGSVYGNPQRTDSSNVPLTFHEVPQTNHLSSSGSGRSSTPGSFPVNGGGNPLRNG